MYANQIDTIIDKILDKLYFEAVSTDPLMKELLEGGKINFVEYREQINTFINKFMDSIDIIELQSIINNRENLTRILDIIKRYVAYYIFLTIAYYYKGTIKDFRNNIIQYSKLQESSMITVKNFYDTQNNYQLVQFYKIVKDSSVILLMTELQKKTLVASDVKDTLLFLNDLGRTYIDEYLLMVNAENTVEINVHNLIKTIAFRELYLKQEHGIVFEILNDVEEATNEYIYIDVVVLNDLATDYEKFRQIFQGEDDMDLLAHTLFKLVTETNTLPSSQSVESINNKLISYKFITPIADDFLRYHRDSEKTETETDKSFMPLVSTDNAKNIQMALLLQQRKKKENTKAQIIVNKIDAMSDYYSDNVTSNKEIQSKIKKYFQNPLAYRKAVLHNYIEEVYILNKIRHSGLRAIETNEYYLELISIIRNAYYNFKDFKKYGTTLYTSPDTNLRVLRYSNIENISQIKKLELDLHMTKPDSVINLVGLALGPFINGPIHCVKKDNLLDIRQTTIKYVSGENTHTKQDENGLKMFLKIVKQFIIDTIRVDIDPDIRIYNNMSDIAKLNPDIMSSVIYWIYDPDLDKFDISTYDNINPLNFQEIIKRTNEYLFMKINRMLKRKLVELINSSKNVPTSTMYKVVYNFIKKYGLDIPYDEQYNLVVEYYLHDKTISPIKIDKNIGPSSPLPMYEYVPDTSLHKIAIDMTNPLKLRKFVEIEAYKPLVKTTKTVDKSFEISTNKCQHENEWNGLRKMKKGNINKYNQAIAEFMQQFVKETITNDYICKICGQVLPLNKYVQDGKFDNTNNRFITSYVPVDIPLEQISEYVKYAAIIKYLDVLTTRISLITGTTMLTGSTSQTKDRRKALVKHVVDIMVIHNNINLSKAIKIDEREELYARKFNINKDLDMVYFFEVDDSILNLTSTNAVSNIDVNRLKYNNMILYYLLIFLTELNSTQIALMYTDKYVNIYSYLKYASKLFGNLLIKTNISDMDTENVTKYPVLCYLIFALAYYLVRHGLWIIPGQQTTKFNPYNMKYIIESILDLFNSISIDAGRMLDDYVYQLTIRKLYTYMSTVFKNNEIIDMLKRNHMRYTNAEANASYEAKQQALNIIHPIELTEPVYIKYKIPTFKPTNGETFTDANKTLYKYTHHITNLTNCESGAYYEWIVKSGSLVSTNCGKQQITSTEADGSINLLVAAYYYSMNIIADRRCLSGSVHNFEGVDGNFVCSICGKKKETVYTESELDTLEINLDEIEDVTAEKIINETLYITDSIENTLDRQLSMYNHLIDTYDATYKKTYGNIDSIIDNFITQLELIVGVDTSFEIDVYPVYLSSNVYVIDHTYNGFNMSKPIILTEKSGRISFKQDHVYFKTDVYFYTDNKEQVDVYYDARTLRLIGYKQKHQDYVQSQATNLYLIISPSIKNRLSMLGYAFRYIDVTDMIKTNSHIDFKRAYQKAFNSLLREHLYKCKSSVDKIKGLMYKILNYDEETSQKADVDPNILMINNYQVIDTMCKKYKALIPDLKMTEDNFVAFDEWIYIRDALKAYVIDWTSTKTNIEPATVINLDNINYYDKSGQIIFYYLFNQLLKILEINNGKNSKINIVQMYVEILVYIYKLNSADSYTNSLDYKRFMYILNASGTVIDIMKKGQGLVEAETEMESETENNNQYVDIDIAPDTDDIEDLAEESQALDVEVDEIAEEYEDYAESGDNYDEQ